MFRKLAALAGAGAMLLSVAMPVMAVRGSCGGGGCGDRGDDLTIWNRARVTNNVITQASTGYNQVVGGMFATGRIRTGDAGAAALVVNDVNYNEVGCGCDGDVDIHNRARVTNNVITQANTGYNQVVGGMLTCGKIRTGDAGASSAISNFVNTNIVGGVDVTP